MSYSSIFNFVLPNGVNIFEDDGIQCVHPSLSENVGKYFSIQPIELCQYSYQEVFIFIDHVRIPNFPLRKVRQRHYKEEVESMHKPVYHYTLWMMTIFFSHSVNRGGVMADRLLATEDEWKVGHDGLITINVDGRPGHLASDNLCKTLKHLWTASHNVSGGRLY